MWPKLSKKYFLSKLLEISKLIDRRKPFDRKKVRGINPLIKTKKCFFLDSWNLASIGV